jgi:hypothetical protein
MPGATSAMLDQCVHSVRRRANAILAGLDDPAGASGNEPAPRESVAEEAGAAPQVASR